MSKTINGKKPISSKPAPTPINMEDIFGNQLGVDPELAKEITDKGMAYRFISAPELQRMGGYHRMGWKPYKRDRDTMDAHSALFGADPDGYVRRGELVLAVRPKELDEKHKAMLRQDANRARAIQTRQANELKDLVRGHSGMQIHEGYDDEGDNDE